LLRDAALGHHTEGSVGPRLGLARARNGFRCVGFLDWGNVAAVGGDWHSHVREAGATREGPHQHSGHFFRSPLSVCAKRACLPTLPGFLAAAAISPAGIFFPIGTPRERWRPPLAPGLESAFWMNFFAISLRDPCSRRLRRRERCAPCGPARRSGPS